MLVLLFVPAAKALFLQGLMKTGIFNASAKKETGNSQALASFSFTDNNNNILSTADLRGKVIFINFWATWCPPCIAEMGSINALYTKLKDNPHIVFILADADGNLQQATAFMQKHQYSLPVYASTGVIPQLLYSGTLPTTIIIDSNGNLAQRHEGIANYDTEAMLAFLKGL